MGPKAITVSTSLEEMPPPLTPVTPSKRRRSTPSSAEAYSPSRSTSAGTPSKRRRSTRSSTGTPSPSRSASASAGANTDRLFPSRGSINPSPISTRASKPAILYKYKRGAEDDLTNPLATRPEGSRPFRFLVFCHQMEEFSHFEIEQCRVINAAVCVDDEGYATADAIHEIVRNYSEALAADGDEDQAPRNAADNRSEELPSVKDNLTLYQCKSSPIDYSRLSELQGKEVNDVGLLLSRFIEEKILLQETGNNLYQFFACLRTKGHTIFPPIKLQRTSDAALEQLHIDLRNTLGLILRHDPLGQPQASPAHTVRYDEQRKCVFNDEVGTPTEVRTPMETVKSEPTEASLDPPSRGTTSPTVDQDSTYMNQISVQPSRASTPQQHILHQDTSLRFLNGRKPPSSRKSQYGLYAALYCDSFANFLVKRLRYEQDALSKCCLGKTADGLDPTPKSVTTDEEYDRDKLLEDFFEELSVLRGGYESTRMEKIQPILENLLGVGADEFVRVRLRIGSLPDRVVLEKKVGACSVVFELKAESASPQDVNIQGQMSYAAVLRAFWQRPHSSKSCAPCFIITLAGQNLTISGAVLPSQVICSHLHTEILTKGWGADQVTVARAGATFRALAECIEDLRKWYEKLENSDIVPFNYGQPERSLHSRFCPWPRSFVMDSSSGLVRVPFKYLYPLHDDQPQSVYAIVVVDAPFSDSHPVWDEQYRKIPYATDEEMKELFGVERGKKLVIKFTSSYGKTCHDYVAQMGHAPKLHSLRRFEQTNGGYPGLYMAVMDFVTGTHLQAGHTTNGELIKSLHQIVQGLGKHKYVHGDLRAQNILVDTNNCIQLVDFSTAIEYDANNPRRLPPYWSDEIMSMAGVIKGILTPEVDLKMVQFSITSLASQSY